MKDIQDLSVLGFLKSIYLFFYLAAPGLSCSMWDLLVVAYELLVASCGI